MKNLHHTILVLGPPMSNKAKSKAAKKAADAEQDFVKSLNAKKVPALRKMCTELGVKDCTGLKADLIVQIIDARSLAENVDEVVITSAKKQGKSKKKKEIVLEFEEEVSSVRKPKTKAKVKAKKIGKVKTAKKPKTAPVKSPVKPKVKKGKTKTSSVKPKVKKGKTKTSPVKPKVKKGKVKKTKTESAYSGKTVSTLKALCKKRGIDAEKCALSRDELVAVLEEYDSLHAGETEVAVVKAKVTKKKASPKKKVVKASPVKKGKAIKKSKVKAKRCDAVDDPLLCEENMICDAKSGACVDNQKGKYSYKLIVDERTIIGTKALLMKLQGILGGDISGPEPKAKKGKGKKEEIDIVFVDDEEKPDEIDLIDDGTPDPERDMSEEDKTLFDQIMAQTRETIGKTSKTTSLQGKLDDLINDEDQDAEIGILKDKIQKIKTGKGPSPKRGVSPKKSPVPPPVEIKARGSTKVELERQEIFETFQKCLESLSA